MSRRVGMDAKTGSGSGASRSLWTTPEPKPLRPLEYDAETDVCIVGAGITGLTLAYLLSPTHRVVVIERGTVGGGDTGRSTAHLTHVLDTDYGTLAGDFGEDGARLAARAHTQAIDFIERTVIAESMACGFERVDGLLVGQPDDAKHLDKVREGAEKVGIQVLAEAAMPFGDERAAPCLRFPRQGHLDPLRYARALAAAAEKRGAEIWTGTQVTRVSGKDDSSRLETAHGPMVSASAVVLATHTPIVGRPGIHARLTSTRTYVIAGEVPRDHGPRIVCWDLEDPYHYVRRAPIDEKRDYLIVGGEDHPTGQAPETDPYRTLEGWARQRFPALGKIEYRWSGQIFEPRGGLGFTGTGEGAKGRSYFATGHSGNGITHGTLSAILLAALVQNGTHEGESVFDPGRKPLGKALDLAKMGVGAIAGFKEHLTGGDVENADDIRPGQAAIVRQGKEKIAAYRDENGTLYECSAACSHMGCVVAWNELERTWDCPCHGSRFDPQGRVLNGPASQALAPASRERV